MTNETKIFIPECHRVDKDYIRSLIKEERFIVVEDMQIVICIIKLKNGHRFLSEAIVANKASFNIKQGKMISRKKNYDEIIKYELYAMRKLKESNLQEV